MWACLLCFQGLAHILDSSELFAVSAPHCKDEIKHPGVCLEMCSTQTETAIVVSISNAEQEFANADRFFFTIHVVEKVTDFDVLKWAGNSRLKILHGGKIMTQNGSRNVHWPQIFRGASSSNRMGWLRKISLDLMQRPRTSASVIWTIFPGRHPRTGEERKYTVSAYQQLWQLLSAPTPPPRCIPHPSTPPSSSKWGHDTISFHLREKENTYRRFTKKLSNLMKCGCNDSPAYSCLLSAVLKKAHCLDYERSLHLQQWCGLIGCGATLLA